MPKSIQKYYSAKIMPFIPCLIISENSRD